MSRVRAAVAICGVLALAAAAVLTLMPIEDETCAQIYEDIYRRSHDPQLIQTTLWLCLGAMNTVQRRLTEDLELEKTRQVARTLEQARIAADRATDAARPVRQLPVDVSRAETEAALAAQVRPSLCPQLAALTGKQYGLSLVQARGGIVLYTLTAHCPECRANEARTFRWLRPDATTFCEGGWPGEDCTAKFAQLQVLFQVDYSGSATELQSILGCP